MCVCLSFSVTGSSLPADQLAVILSTLLDGLQGRTWDGKVRGPIQLVVWPSPLHCFSSHAI